MSDIERQVGIVIGKLDEIDCKIVDFICEQRKQHLTLEERVGKMESWRDTLIAKISIIVSVIGACFTALGYWLKSKFN